MNVLNFACTKFQFSYTIIKGVDLDKNFTKVNNSIYPCSL